MCLKEKTVIRGSVSCIRCRIQSGYTSNPSGTTSVVASVITSRKDRRSLNGNPPVVDRDVMDNL